MNSFDRGVGRRILAFTLAGVMAVALAGVAEARPGGKGSFGSRGSRTFEAPPATRTAPSTAQPMQRSQTTPSQVQAGPTAAAAQAAQPARSRFGGGFFAGLLGAGLLGALFGAGLFGGLGSLASILGFLLQLALIGGLVYLAVQFFRRRQQPAMAGAGANGPMQRSALGGLARSTGTAHAGAGASVSGGTAAASAHRQTGTVEIGPDDYAAFERSLHEIQMAYGREDVAALWSLVTPEMAGYFQEELNENARQGVLNTISGVKLVQGDLAEAWREGTTDYATVAMRFELTEQMVDRATRQPSPSDAGKPEEVTEVWTFRREAGGDWKLSAIQQVA
jgi:predicted lipid-binding transport protein (Tim44 family)